MVREPPEISKKLSNIKGFHWFYSPKNGTITITK